MVGVVLRIVVVSGLLVVVYLRLRAAKLAGKQVIEEHSRAAPVTPRRHEWRPLAPRDVRLDHVREIVAGARADHVVGAREAQIGATTITVFDLQVDPPPAHPFACTLVTMPHVEYPHLVFRSNAPADDSEFARRLLDEQLRTFLDGEQALRGLVIAGCELVVVLDSAFALYDRATGVRVSSDATALYPADLVVPGDVEHRLGFVAGVLERIPAAVRDQFRTREHAEPS